jgi:hypothetical protein
MLMTASVTAESGLRGRRSGTFAAKQLHGVRTDVTAQENPVEYVHAVDRLGT